MKKYLLPKEGNFYKANLHCHSTCSDGALTPEELKEEYKSRGYSVLAYTDHDIMLSHAELADDDFLPLNGYEMEINEPKDDDFNNIKTCHMCFIALEPDNLKMACYNRKHYIGIGASQKYREVLQYYEDEPDYIREYTPQKISDMMKQGRDHGFFVTYNHPAWSLEDYEQYINYHNMHAMEICNYDCYCAGYDDYNTRVYDDMLRSGKRIYCIGADDNHNRAKRDSRHWDSGGAYIMIKAPELKYRTITKALENGDFYASQGPEIYDLWVEDGKIHINCSDADRIIFNFGNRNAYCAYAEKEGESINYSSCTLRKPQIYVRITVVDHSGKKANTNAYFIDEILDEE